MRYTAIRNDETIVAIEISKDPSRKKECILVNFGDNTWHYVGQAYNPELLCKALETLMKTISPALMEVEDD